VTVEIALSWKVGQIWWRSAVPILQILTWSRGFEKAEVDWETVYASGPHGYADYPTTKHRKITRKWRGQTQHPNARWHLWIGATQAVRIKVRAGFWRRKAQIVSVGHKSRLSEILDETWQ